MTKTAALKEKVRDYLCKQRRGEKLSSPEIAEALYEGYKGKKSLKQLIGEVSSTLTRNMDEFKVEVITSSRPRQYYYAGEKLENAETENKKQVNKQLEKDLYIPLQRYLAEDMRLYCKEVTVSNRKNPIKNEWLHPDIVGMEDMVSGWKNKTG